MPDVPIKSRSVISNIIGFVTIFSIVFVLLYGCGFSALQYDFLPSATVRFSIKENSEYERVIHDIVPFSKRKKFNTVVNNDINNRVHHLSVFIFNKNYDISLDSFLRGDMSLAFNKSRIPGLRQSDKQMEALMQEFITTLTTIDGVDLKKIEYFDRKGELIRTLNFNPAPQSEPDHP